MTQTTRSYWLLIETGGNQRYIFGSNRLRHVVGASQIVHEVGTEWVRQAVKAQDLPDEAVVMTASGKALLLVDSAEAGQRVIGAVTDRALRDAPGLQVTGVIGPGFDPQDPVEHENARKQTYELHARVRAARPDPLMRDRVFPWHQLCRDSGHPAAVEELYDTDPRAPDATWQPASAAVAARSQARGRAETRIRNLLGSLADVVPEHLDELRHDGWVAVVHADGNGVGGLFRRFVEHVAQAEGIEHADQVPLPTQVRYQGAVAHELDTATQGAVVAAVAELPWPLDELAGRFMPIVVGGDDVTVACDAALALPFVRAFARAFERHTAEQPTLSAIVRAATGRPALTASAGIAVVKPHHPFAAAYDLAEALTISAKHLNTLPGRAVAGRTVAAFDVHVAHASTLREPADLREYAHRGDGTAIARHGGPYLLTDTDDSGLPDGLWRRGVPLLDEVTGWLGTDGWLSATQAHALREAADRSLDEYQHQLRLVLDRAGDAAPTTARDLLDVQDDADQPFLRLFDAMHLRGLRLEPADESTAQTESISEGGA